MKKSIPYIFCLSMLSLSAFAQIPKGTGIIGGSISLSHQKSKPKDAAETTSSSFGVQPGYARFVINNLAVGVLAGLDLDKTETKGAPAGYSTLDKSRSISAGPFVRYYVPFNSKLYAFGQGSYEWQWSRFESQYNNLAPPHTVVDKVNTSSWGLAAGLSYFLNPNIALEASLGYTHDRKKNDDPDNSAVTTHKIGGLSVNVGFQLFLRKAE